MTHFTALERLLRTERVRQRAARQGGFSLPAMNEVSLSGGAAPLLATNMKGSFLPTRPSKDGVARYGFSHVPVECDDILLRVLHGTLWELSTQQGWSNRCKTVVEALHRLSGFGLEPKTIIVGPQRLAEVTDVPLKEAWEAMQANKEVAKVDEAVVLLADLPEGAALVGTAPPLVGLYTRTGDHLGVLLQRVHQTLVVIQ